MIVEEIVTSALGLSGPEVLALKLGAMVVSDLLTRPQPRASADLSVLSSVPGRVRLSVAGLKGSSRMAQRIEERVGRLAGVSKVSANTLTGTVLVSYAPDRIDVEAISRSVRLSGMALRTIEAEPEYRVRSLEAVAS